MAAKRIQGLGKGDEVAGNHPRPLMDQLIERVLSIGSRFSPINWAGFAKNSFSIERNVFPVALHRQLLQICRKALQVLFVGQHSYCLCAEEVAVPEGEQSHKYRQVRLERGRAEVL